MASKEIYEKTHKKLSDENCQSLTNIGIEAIDEGKRHLYNEMYNLAHDTNEGEVLLFLERFEDKFLNK